MVINAREKNKAGKEIRRCQTAGVGSHQKVTFEQRTGGGEGPVAMQTGKTIPGRKKSK